MGRLMLTVVRWCLQCCFGCGRVYQLPHLRSMRRESDQCLTLTARTRAGGACLFGSIDLCFHPTSGCIACPLATACSSIPHTVSSRQRTTLYSCCERKLALDSRSSLHSAHR